MKKFLSLSLGLIFIGNFLSAQNFTAVASGNWSSNTTWGTAPGVYPGAAAGTLTVTIPVGFAVTLDVSPANFIGALAIAVGNGNNTLTVCGDITGTQISVIGAAATSTLNISGVASTVGNLIMNGAAASILDLNGNLSVAGTLTLTNGKIDIGPNLLALTNATPATQLAGGSATSYVYTTVSGGRLIRQGLTAATNFTFPIGTLTNYMPVVVNTAAGLSNFAASVYSPAAADATVGGPPFSAATLLRSVDAMWVVERPVGAGTSTLTLQWVAGLEGATFAALANTSIGISRYNGTSWTNPPIQTSGNNTTNIVTANFTAFGTFAVTDIGAVLPAKFGSIKAYEKQTGIQLDWKIYSEDKVNSYEIERSADGRSYTTVGSLAALHNDGDYGFFDANPLPGISYYRIKNNDLDGRSSYSIVMKVNRNKAIRGLSLYPNPVLNGIVTLQGSDLSRGNYKISIFGSNGQEIYRQQIQHNGGTLSQTIELPTTMSKGINMFLLKDENGNIIYKEKLVNQ